MLQAFVPYPFGLLADGAAALEQRIEATWEKVRGESHASLASNFFQRDDGAILLILNGSVLQTGKRFIIAPATLPLVPTSTHVHSHISPELALRTSTAAIASARFPLVTPPAFFRALPCMLWMAVISTILVWKRSMA